MSSASAHLKRDRPWLTSPVMKRGKTEEDKVYAVYEQASEDLSFFQYLIYKLDDSVDEQQPILTLTSPDYKVGYGMAVFSLGSRVYFCGGWEVGEDSKTDYYKDAYVLDINSTNPVLCPIKPMNEPKHIDPGGFGLFGCDNPLVFGPIGGDKFYLITRVLAESVIGSSFEMLDTSAEKWTSLPLPSYDLLADFPWEILKEDYIDDFEARVQELFTIDAYTVCNSNIYISTMAALFVYSIEKNSWSASGHQYTRERFRPLYNPSNLPFLNQAHPIISFQNGNESQTISVAAEAPLNDPQWIYHDDPIALLRVYKSPCLPPPNNPSADDIYQSSGEVDNLKDHLADLTVVNRVWTQVFSDNYIPTRLYVVRSGKIPKSVLNRRKGRYVSVITMCDLGLMEGAEVKVVKSKTYKVYGDGIRTEPRHLFSVA